MNCCVEFCDCDFSLKRLRSCLLFFKQKTAYEMRISDWSSDVCSSDLPAIPVPSAAEHVRPAAGGTAAGSPLAALPGLGTGCCGIRNKQPRHRYSPTARCCGSEFPVTNLSQWLWKNNSRKCRSEEHTSELQSLMRTSYADLCLKKKTTPP